MALTPEQIINNALSNTAVFTSSAEQALSDAQNASKSFAWVVGTPFNFNYQITKPTFNYTPEVFAGSFVTPVKDAVKPVLEPFYIPQLPSIPDAPVINTSGLFNFDRPSTNVPTFNGVVPTPNTDAILSEANALEKPVVTTFAEPTLTDVTIKPLPTVTLPTFDVSLSVDMPPDAPDLESKYLNTYDRVLPAMKSFIDEGIKTWIDTYSPNHTENFALLESKLSEGMRTGTALPEQYTTALRNSARKEIDTNHAAQEQAVLSDNEKRGFFTAPGTVSAGLRRVKQASGAALANMNTEIFKQRKEQEIQHIQFCMTAEASLQQGLLQMMMGYAGVLGDVNRNAMGFAQSIVTILADLYRLLFDRARLQMEYLKVQVELYEAKLKASLAILDEYRLELEASKLVVDIDQTRINLWAQKWQVQAQEMDIYLKQLQAVVDKAQLIKLQLEVFGQSVEAYNAQLGSKKLEVEIYEAALTGDKAKLEGLMTQLTIYQTEVETVKARNAVEISHSEAISAVNKNLLEIYSAELNAFNVSVSAESQRYGAEVQGYTARLDAFKTANATKVQSLEADVTLAKLNLEATETKFKADLETRLKNADLFMNGVQIQSQTALGIGGHYGSMAQAGLSAQNTMISLTQAQ